MTLTGSFSVDTPSPSTTRVLSGYNFREVAPEVLSPLSWSVVGAGMEQGFREIAAAVRVPFPEAQPMFVAYLAFRPFHVLSSVDRLLRGLPGITRSDPWELLFGGPPAAGAEVRPRNPAAQVAGTLRQVALLRRNGERHGAVAELVAAAESELLRTRRRGGSWGLGEAAARVVEAGREAWALHCRTTSAMVGAAALLRRALAPNHEPDEVRLLLAGAARRASDEMVSSAQPGMIDDEPAHLCSYEVASLNGRFADASVQESAVRAWVAGSPTATVEVEVLLGSPLGGVHERLVRLLRLCVAEREQSKNLGLRALHCLRLLLKAGLSDLAPEDAALLGVRELRDLDRGRQRALVDRRAEELERARTLTVPIDLRQTGRGVERLLRPEAASRRDRGVALAPGWAEGRPMWIGDPDSLDDGDILCGRCVDGNHVLAVRPAGVVTEIGSLLSHVAIVCRELGIPLVAGFEAHRDHGVLTVDGWSGTVVASRERSGTAP